MARDVEMPLPGSDMSTARGSQPVIIQLHVLKRLFFSVMPYLLKLVANHESNACMTLPQPISEATEVYKNF